jgi:pyridoxine 5'-phosphate synthase PdxJ
MEITISAVPYQFLRKTNPEIFLPLPEYFSKIPFEKIKSLMFLYDKDQIEEIKILCNYFSYEINLQIGATPEQMHELLSIKPPKATLSNLQRKDNCLDLLLFKEQIQELLQNFQFPKENLKVRIEADPEQIKTASKLGFSKAELDFAYPFKNEKEFQKFDETIKVAQKMGVFVSFGKGLKLKEIKDILAKFVPDELVVDIPFYQFSFQNGIKYSIDFFDDLKKKF